MFEIPQHFAGAHPDMPSKRINVWRIESSLVTRHMEHPQFIDHCNCLCGNNGWLFMSILD
jgi:hypothetical protein